MQIERNSRKILARLRTEGWLDVGATGSHHKLKHPGHRPDRCSAPSQERPAGRHGSPDCENCRMAVRFEMKIFYGLVHKENDSAFGITFPDAPGCFSAADEESDLLTNAQEALSLFVEGATVPDDASDCGSAARQDRGRRDRSRRVSARSAADRKPQKIPLQSHARRRPCGERGSRRKSLRRQPLRIRRPGRSKPTE